MTSKHFVVPSIRNYPSRRDWEAACWKKLLSSPSILKLLVTANERHSLVLRAAAVSSIYAGKGSRQISRELWLSRQTISAIRKAIHEQVYRSYRERGKTECKRGSHGSKEYRTKVHRGRSVRTKYKTLYLP